MNDLLLLATLLEGPKHGYALKKQAGLILGEAELQNNLVYPLLRRFERVLKMPSSRFGQAFEVQSWLQQR
jgi:hypothetical protein